MITGLCGEVEEDVEEDEEDREEERGGEEDEGINEQVAIDGAADAT